ncbi:hypothetical protein ABIE49_006152 [Bradyrhizobium sp. OAE829]
MYDVYTNRTNDLLVLLRGNEIPAEVSGSWRKKRAVRSVSAPIREDVLTIGFHRRSLSALPDAATSAIAAGGTYV